MSKNPAEELCREFRRASTPHEARLWGFLKNRQLGGLKFRRQHPFGGIIADFYCAEARLVVEVDGAVHNEPEQRVRDIARDQELASRGIAVLRITNDEVEFSLSTVLRRIMTAATEKKQSGS